MSKEDTKQDKILTCTTSIRYPEMKLLRVTILCSESLVGLESSTASILSMAQALSKGGFINWNTNTSRKFHKNQSTDNQRRKEMVQKPFPYSSRKLLEVINLKENKINKGLD